MNGIDRDLGTQRVLHLALFAWTPERPVDHDLLLHEAFSRLADRFGTAGTYRFGPDVSTDPQNFHFGVCAAFDSWAAFDEYREDPEHIRVGPLLIRPWLVRKAVIQFAIWP